MLILFFFFQGIFSGFILAEPTIPKNHEELHRLFEIIKKEENLQTQFPLLKQEKTLENQD